MPKETESQSGGASPTPSPTHFEDLTPEQRIKLEAILQGRRSMLKELHASGAVSGVIVANELLLLLPAAFVDQYTQLFWKAFRDPMKSRVTSGDGSEGLPVGTDGGTKGLSKADRADRVAGRKVALGKARGTTGTVLGSETRAQAQGTGKKFKEHGLVLGSEQAFNRKKWIDRKLHELAMDMQESMRTMDENAGNGDGKGNGGKGGGTGGKLRQNRCSGKGCRRVMDWKWRFCPECGSPAERND